MTDGLLIVAIVLLLVVVAMQVVGLLRRQGVDWSPLESRLAETMLATEKASERAERAVREEIARNRDESARTAQNARQEVAGALKAVGDSLTKQLSEALQQIDQRLLGMRNIVEERLDTLQNESTRKLDQVRTESTEGVQKVRQEVAEALKAFNDGLRERIDNFLASQHRQFNSVVEQLTRMSETNEKRLDAVRVTIEERLKNIQEDNGRNLEAMRQTVDEKLQGTLEKRLGESFKLVSERLEQVYKGLGEMQSLAAGVGDLKRVLTNVKMRGAWGEVQLERMLEQVLNTEQYEKNVATKGGGERVEFAIKLPGRGDDRQVVWLPIDAKFPIEDYQRLQDAQELGDAAAVEQAGKQLEIRIRGCADDINKKYLDPPNTTDFGILFLPTEGLFAEVVRRPGLADAVQSKSKVVIAGPTTLWSLLNSLQMGFRTLAIEKRSSEVWNLLAAIKTEFGKYGEVLGKVQKKLQEASNTIDTAATRTRAIERKLRDVQELPSADAQSVLMIESSEVDDGVGGG